MNAVGYNVYRRVIGQPPTIAPVNAQPDQYTWFIDDNGGQGLPNGTHCLYSVRAVFQDTSGRFLEGAPSSEVVVTPQVPILGGFLAYDIGTVDLSGMGGPTRLGKETRRSPRQRQGPLSAGTHMRLLDASPGVDPPSGYRPCRAGASEA